MMIVYVFTKNETTQDVYLKWFILLSSSLEPKSTLGVIYMAIHKLIATKYEHNQYKKSKTSKGHGSKKKKF